MRKLILLLIIFTFLFSASLKAEEVSLTLDEAIAIALRENRDILLKTEDLKKAKEKISEAKSNLLPTLNFTSSMANTKGYYPKDLTQTTAQTTLKQYLYKGGKTTNTIEQTKYNLQVTEALLDKTRIEIVWSIKKAFYTLLLAQEFAALNKNILENIRVHIDSLKQRYQNGEVAESEILTIESSLANVEQAYQESLNQIESSQVLLGNLLYLDKDTTIKAEAQFNYESIEVAYDEAFLKAMSVRPEIKQYKAQLKADEKAVDISKADNRPSIYASWDYYSRSHSTATTNKSWNDYNIIGLTLSWPIFDGWLTKSKVEQAIIDLKETQLLREKTVKDITLELKNAYLALKDAIAKIQAVESEIKVYSDNLISINKKYKQGIASLIDMEDAGLKYEISNFNKKQAIYDYVITKSNFDKATGGF